MAETVAVEHPDLSALTGSPTQKRKRIPESSSPDSRRTKRSAPTAAMTVTDAATQAYIESAVNAVHNAAAHDHVNVEDFNALQQAAAEHSDAADPANASSTAAAALNSIYPTLHIPPSTEETFAQQNVLDSDHQDGSFNGSSVPPTHGLPIATPTGEMQSSNGTQQEQRFSSSGSKPAVGSEEWHKMRKDNHKEVERRRRETINEGINELAKIVPGCEKNKGSILQRAVLFITQLKENEDQNLEKWTLEKLLTEQAINELSTSNDKLKGECERLYRELEKWKRVAQNAGLSPPEEKPATTS